MAGFFVQSSERNKNVKVKDAMLEYLTEIMDDAQDFGWASAKGAHALLQNGGGKGELVKL